MNHDGHLNWKDHPNDNGGTGGCSQARAARALGGKYHITRFKGGVNWFGNIEETHYRIDYYAPGDHNGKFVRHPRGTPGTLSEAKQMAEEDHAARIETAAK